MTNQQEFKQVLESGSGKVTLLQFTATWCQPCRMLGPILQRLTKPGTNYDLVVVDIDNEVDFAEEHKVSADRRIGRCFDCSTGH